MDLARDQRLNGRWVRVPTLMDHSRREGGSRAHGFPLTGQRAAGNLGELATRLQSSLTLPFARAFDSKQIRESRSGANAFAVPGSTLVLSWNGGHLILWRAMRLGMLF